MIEIADVIWHEAICQGSGLDMNLTMLLIETQANLCPVKLTMMGEKYQIKARALIRHAWHCAPPASRFTILSLRLPSPKVIIVRDANALVQTSTQLIPQSYLASRLVRPTTMPAVMRPAGQGGDGERNEKPASALVNCLHTGCANPASQNSSHVYVSLYFFPSRPSNLVLCSILMVMISWVFVIINRLANLNSAGTLEYLHDLLLDLTNY